MRCPVCSTSEDKVIDTRVTKENSVIRRRRECLSCSHRFTTYERIELILPQIVKKDKRKEDYNREKLIAGIRRACQKRPVSNELILQVADNLEQKLNETGKKEVDSKVLGEFLMEELRTRDEIAYVRFASVYKSFNNVDEFVKEIQDLNK